ncbi:MAG: carboxypeptidase regulatory-like domain-containing protein, partial [Bacteroidetes bacterium]|nr:carboxypeptidase regulatory-like domain-containing protein [Bacteroidota bacterium]
MRSDSGDAISQVHVELVYLPTAMVYHTFTEDDGQYVLRGLRVGGPYRLKVSHVGYGSQVRTGLVLKLLEQTRLDIVLREADLTTEEVVITGTKTDLLATQKPGVSEHVTQDQLDALPLPSASFEEAGRLSPYMVGSSALGLNRIYNDVSVDGLGFGDSYGLQHVEANIAGMYDNPLTLESIQEVRVDLSPYDVRRSGFTAAAISAVTRGGTRHLTGSLNLTTAPGWFIGRNPDDGRPDAEGFADGRASFRIGGPLTESHSFYFVAGELTHMRVPIERRFGAPTTKGTTYSISPGTVMQLSSVFMSAHGYDPGRFDEVNVDRNSANLFARFDFELSPDHRLSARYNLISTQSDRPPYGRTVFAAGALSRNDNREHSLSFELNSILGSWITNEFLLGFSSRRFTSTPQGTPFPFVDVIVVDRLNWWNHLTAGNEIGGTGDRVSQDHLEIRNTTSLSAGKHLVAIGAQADLHWFESTLLANQWGRYTFTSAAALERRQAQAYELRYLRDSLSGGGTAWRAMQLSGYIQDEWTVSPEVSLFAGLRV